MLKNYQLPTVERDLWQQLAVEERPLVIYGMGNGADKLIARLTAIGKAPAAIFASDDFVRGQSFHGFRVCRFSEIKERFSDFVILVSFGSRLPAVMDALFDMAEKYPLYLPDMPVAGEVDFTYRFYQENEEKIRQVCDLLADDLSRRIYTSVLQYKLTGDILYLRDAYSSEEEEFSCFDNRAIRTAIDGGAYNGDTAGQMIRRFPSLRKILAVEPDAKTFKKLSKFAADRNDAVEILPIHAALWSEQGDGAFSASGNRNSSLASASYEHKDVVVPLLTVDSLAADEKIDYIKYDVEGVEREALLGSRGVITRDHPVLAVSLYHRSEDLFDLPLLIRQIDKNYRFYLRRTSCLPAWEITLLAV